MNADCLGLVVSYLSKYRDALSLLMVCKSHYYNRSDNWWSSVRIGVRKIVKGAWLPLLRDIKELPENCPLPSAWNEFRKYGTTYGFQSLTLLINNGVYQIEVVQGLEEILNKRYNIYNNDCLKACIRNLYGCHAEVFIDGDLDSIQTCIKDKSVQVSHLIYLICHYIQRTSRMQLLSTIFTPDGSENYFKDNIALISKSIDGNDFVTLLKMFGEEIDHRCLTYSDDGEPISYIPEVNALLIEEGVTTIPHSMMAYRPPSSHTQALYFIRYTTCVDIIAAAVTDFNIPQQQLLADRYLSKEYLLEYLSREPGYAKGNLPSYSITGHPSETRLNKLLMVLRNSNLVCLDISSRYFTRIITGVLGGSKRDIEILLLSKGKIDDADGLFEVVSSTLLPFLSSEMIDIIEQFREYFLR